MAWSTGANREPLGPYDLLADRERMLAALADSPEVARLAAGVNPGDMKSILTFGQEPAREIGQTSDALLRGMGPGLSEDPGDLLEALAGVMGRVAAGEAEPRPGLLGRLFGGGKPREDDLPARYEALGADLDRVYVGLKAYEAQLARDNRSLEQLFQANLGYFHELEKYVLAGEKAHMGLARRLAEGEAALSRGGDGALSFEVQTLRSAVAAMERRVSDLRAAEAVAMQCIPMIRVLQLNNRELSNKIDAAFVATLPAFRRALAEAVQQKRARLQGEGLAALNARARDTQALETSRRAILAGIEETKGLQAEARARRDEAARRLDRANEARSRSGGNLPPHG